MNNYKTSATLKNLAKDKLTGKYGMAMLILFLSEIISQSITYIAALFIPSNTIISFIISLFISLLLSIVTGVLQVGICLFFLNIACNQPYQINDLFYGFTSSGGSSSAKTNKCISISFVFSLIQFICLLPYQMVSYFGLNTPAFQTFLLPALLCWLGGMFFSIIFTLSIFPAYYLILDFPDLSAKEILQKSQKIMKGQKGKLFYIQISFLPLMLLCLLTCGIGFLWILPYMQMTLALFFLDIMHPAN